MKTSSPQLLRLVAAALLSCAAGATSAQTVLGKNAPSFPIVIDQPGSYVLAANLVVAANSVKAIHVTAPNVTIDLNGFSIVGPNTCNRTTKVCTQPFVSASAGVYSSGANTTVMNGVVAGFSNVGVYLQSRGGTLRNMVVEHNRGAGASVEGRIENVTAQLNGFGLLSSGGLIINSHSTRNLAAGFYIAGGMLIGSSAIENGGWGVAGSGASAGVRESMFAGNASAAFGGVTSMGNNLCNGVAC
jgi:hypothetical protein